MIEITLPWPPTANTYWRRNGNTYFISSKGIAYRDLTIFKCQHLKNTFPKEKKLVVVIYAYPPDKRRRDIDNITKCLLDSLQHAGVYEDDSQIDELTIRRFPELRNQVNIIIGEIDSP